MKKLKKVPIRIGSQQKEILFFVWRWKVVSNNMLLYKFFSEKTNPKNACKCCLRKLMRNGFIKRYYALDALSSGWQLTKKGYAFLKEFLPELRKEGFLSDSVNHDLKVNCVTIGAMLRQQIDNAKLHLCSDQELKTLDSSILPSWISKDLSHRPDAYFRILDNTKEKKIALEVETSLKSIDRYMDIGNFYNDNEFIDMVIWFVERRKWISTMQKGFNKCLSSSRDIHYFFLWDEFEINNFEVESFFSQNVDQKLSELLNIRLRPEPDPGRTLAEPPGVLNLLLRHTRTLINTNFYKEVTK